MSFEKAREECNKFRENTGQLKSIKTTDKQTDRQMDGLMDG